jgi:hypothetical protein
MVFFVKKVNRKTYQGRNRLTRTTAAERRSYVEAQRLAVRLNRWQAHVGAHYAHAHKEEV